MKIRAILLSLLSGVALLGLAACLSTQGGGKASMPWEEKQRGWNLPGKPPHLAAHYMPWFEIDRAAPETSKPSKPLATRLPSSWYEDEKEADASSRTWRHWKWDNGGPVRDPEQRWASGQRKISSICYPLIGPYNSRSRDVVRYHLRTARAAGIQAFLVIWYGPGSFEDQNIPVLLDEAQKAGMKIAICYEEKINFKGFRNLSSREEVVSSVVEDLNTILEKYAAHPAYLRRDGLPFIYQFNGWGSGAGGPNYLTPAEWKDVFSQLSTPIVYGRQNLDEQYHPPIQSAYTWWSPDGKWLEHMARRGSELVREGRLQFYMTPICPGFDDTGVWGWGQGPRKNERFGLSTLRNTFDLSFTGNPELIQIVTWNDFAEGTPVEPTRENGFQYLDAIETWWGEKTGRPVDLADNRDPFFYYVSKCSTGEADELPEPPYDALLAPKPLTVENPRVLMR